MAKQAILFDFWQTLFIDSKERDTFSKRIELTKRFLADHGYDGDLDVAGAFERLMPRFWQVYHEELRTPLVAERLTWAMEELGITLKEPELTELAEEFGNMGILLNPMPTPNIAEVLSELRAYYSLGIVSDTGYTPGRVLRQLMARHGLLEYFSAFSFSDETGHAKPHRRQFENVLEQLEVAPESAIHCGDLPDHDVNGAEALGITSVLYTGCHAAEVEGIKPDYTISDWRELPPIVDKVFG